MPVIANKHVIQEKLRITEADAVLLTDATTIRWATGFTGSNAVVALRTDEAHIFTDRRYTTQVGEEVSDYTIHVPGYDLFGALAKQQILRPGDIVLLLSDEVTLAYYEQLVDLFPEVIWTTERGWLRRERAVKTSVERDAITRAQDATDEVFEAFVDVIKPGVSEQELAAELVYLAMKHGAEKMAFDPIIASGPNSAMPHARPTHRQVQPNDVVLIDFGVVIGGYASDMTRTLKLGDRDERFETVYHTVYQAHQQAIDAVCADIASNALDEVARSVIRDAGYADYFGHSLGHGVGLDVHEWPSVSFRSEEAIPNHSVITIEPGIYLPGAFGVRIEDLVVVEPDQGRSLTQTPATLRYI